VHTGVLKKHTKFKIGEGIKPVYCSKHPRKELELHCIACNEDICSVCSIVGHKGHDVDSLDSFAESCREDISKGASELSSRANKILLLKTDIESCIQKVQKVLIWSIPVHKLQRHSDFEVVIQETFEEIRLALGAREKQLLDQSKQIQIAEGSSLVARCLTTKKMT
jgi:hypothetical protein